MESEEDKISPENKKRRLKTPQQVEGLESFYAEHKYPSEAMKSQLSEELGLTEKQVQGWFCHRRLKDKRLMKEEASNNGKQDPHNGIMQDSVNGVKQDSSGSGKKSDHQRHSRCKEVESQRFANAMDYPAAVLASELRDHDLFKVNHDNEDTFAGSSSASQDRSSLQSGNPYEAEARRRPFQNGKHYEFEGKRKNRSSYMDPYSEEDGEHEAITAVREQLGDEYREDGPPLGVEFHPLPPGAFDDSTEPPYQGNIVVQDIPRMPKKMMEPDTRKMFRPEGFHTPCSTGVGLGYMSVPMGLKFERASPKFERASPKCEWASYSKHESLNIKSAWRPANNHLQIGDNYHVPDLNSSMQLDEDSPDDSPSSEFVTKSYPAWHKQEPAGRLSSDAHLPLPYGSKNGMIPGKVLNAGKEFSIPRPYNGGDIYHDTSGVNPNVKAAMPPLQSRDLLSSQGEDKFQPKKMTKRERLREERKIKREQDSALRLKQKLIPKEEKMNTQMERKKQMEEIRKPREVAKCLAANEKVALSKNLMKGHTGEIPNNFSGGGLVAACSSME